MSPQYYSNEQTERCQEHPTSPWTETFRFRMDMTAQPEQCPMDAQPAWSDEFSPTYEALSATYNRGY